MTPAPPDAEAPSNAERGRERRLFAAAELMCALQYAAPELSAFEMSSAWTRAFDELKEAVAAYKLEPK